MRNTTTSDCNSGRDRKRSRRQVKSNRSNPGIDPDCLPILKTSANRPNWVFGRHNSFLRNIVGIARPRLGASGIMCYGAFHTTS
jgi:hypothetical protein